MKAVKFKDQNVTFAKDQPEYKSLPALALRDTEGHVITCWDFSLRERIKVLFYGRMWLSLMTFNKPLNPIAMSTNRKDLYYDTAMDDTKKWWGQLFNKIFK